VLDLHVDAGRDCAPKKRMMEGWGGMVRCHCAKGDGGVMGGYISVCFRPPIPHPCTPPHPLPHTHKHKNAPRDQNHESMEKLAPTHTQTHTPIPMYTQTHTPLITHTHTHTPTHTQNAPRDQNHESMQKLAAVSIWRTAHDVGFVAASTQRAEKWFTCVCVCEC
jgi:hypothetical protein